MKKKVIMHIGHAKTATTSIQETFKGNRSILDDNGYCYPLLDGSKDHNGLFITLFKNNFESYDKLLFMQHIDLTAINDLKRNYDQWLRKKLANSNANVFIISGEYFPNFTEDELESIKEYFHKLLGEVDFEIFAFSRDPVSYASSAYQQRARRSVNDNKAIYFPYEEKISKYINVFGKSHINIYKLEDACKDPKGPVCFLLNKIGLRDEIIDQMNIRRRNESMTDLSLWL